MRSNRKGTNGTGRDIPTVYVPSRPAVPPFAARDKGHSGTLSRYVPLSRFAVRCLDGTHAFWISSWMPPALLAFEVPNQRQEAA
jgi:hypothetical protein